LKGKGGEFMKKSIATMGILFGLMIVTVFLPHQVRADIEWTMLKEINVKSPPLDVSSSADGQMLYILSPGEILIYSLSDKKVTNRIPISGEFDRLTVLPGSNSLIATSSTQKSLRIINLEFIQKIDISGHPVRGSKNAPVTVAVFVDYQ
jgi:hypothetical protein